MAVEDVAVRVEVPADAGRTAGAARPGNAEVEHQARLRLAHASRETAKTRIEPLNTFWYSGFTLSRLKPLPIICRKKAPSTARQIAPSPPRIETPPSTTAVIASNVFAELLESAWAVATSEDRITPAIPAESPEMANVAVRTSPTRTPESRAA